MYRCEIWTIKKAEHRRINAFELWRWRRPLRVPCTAKRSSQSILKEIIDYWSWSSNTLATECEEPTHWKRPQCWERRKQKEKGVTEFEMFRLHHQLNGHEFKQTPGNREGQGSLCAAVRGVTESQTWLRNWEATKNHICMVYLISAIYFFKIFFDKLAHLIRKTEKSHSLQGDIYICVCVCVCVCVC